MVECTRRSDSTDVAKTSLAEIRSAISGEGGTRLRTDGIKAMSRGFSGGKRVINVSNTRNRGRVCFFLTTENEQLFILKTIMANYG